MLLSEDLNLQPPGGKFGDITVPAFAAAERATVAALPTSKVPVGIVMGTPFAAVDPPQCLAAHPTDVQSCSSPVAQAFYEADTTISSALSQAKGKVINVSMLFCASTCTDVIHGTFVHSDRWHLDQNCVKLLSRPLGALIG